MKTTAVYLGKQLAAYNFGASHPFGPARHDAFVEEFKRRQLDKHVTLLEPVSTDRQSIELFQDSAYVEQVIQMSVSGEGMLDGGDTPAFRNMYEASLYVAGSVLDGIRRVLDGDVQNAFIPIAGLHHARRDHAAGFCVFNDCGIAIETLRKLHGIQRVAYVDIDAHHGDGVFYSFEHDADLCFIDIHEDGQYLYPGTGGIEESGKGDAIGSKLNIPAPPGATDAFFMKVWPTCEKFLRKAEPEFILFQCGADSLDGDPITHMRYSAATHGHAARRLRELATELCQGRLLACGGGGYNLDNIAQAWCAVVEGLAGV